jgi:hypothetical protein
MRQDVTVGERISLEVLRIKNQIGREIGIFMTPRIELAQLRYNSLKEPLVGKALSCRILRKALSGGIPRTPLSVRRLTARLARCGALRRRSRL